MESPCRNAVTQLCIDVGEACQFRTRGSLGVVMRVPNGPVFRPFDYALLVGFAMAFIMLTTLRLA